MDTAIIRSKSHFDRLLCNQIIHLFFKKKKLFFQLIPVTIYSIESVSLPCHQLESLSNAKSIQINGTIFSITNIVELTEDLEHLKKVTWPICQQNYSINNSSERLLEIRDPDFRVDMKMNLTRVTIGHTDLMKDDSYYNIYCIGINTIFASLFPFISLMFFNVRIALKLRSKKVTILLFFV